MVSNRQQKPGLAVGEKITRYGAGFSDFEGALQLREVEISEKADAFRIVGLGAESDQADLKLSLVARPESVRSVVGVERVDQAWRVTEGLPEAIPIGAEEIEVLEIYLGPLFDKVFAKR